jgi:hypothetical protein
MSPNLERLAAEGRAGTVATNNLSALCRWADPLVKPVMNFDDQLRRYFATSDLAAVTPDVLVAGIDKMKVDLGMEQDKGRRFALWTMLHMLGAAPDLDVAFKDPADRDAARSFMEIMERAEAEAVNGERR